jgi:hypothetical protein
MIADIKPADLMNTLQQYGPGSHAIVRSRSPVNNYYNLDHVFNIVHTSSGYNIGIDAYHPIFFNEALSHLPNYIRDNYHPDVTFDSIIFLPKNFW